ncbi:MAG: LLM class flavin-dependent oxidoreductase [Hyphomonadaceae bacterium]
MSLNNKKYGVFLPIANGGWIISKNTPELTGLYAQNRTAAQISDRIGLDFIMSMAKWRGFGGETNHWAVSMESMVMMAGLAEVTSKVKVWATMHALLHNPAVVAKMVTTLDHISKGRAGLNIVAGAYREEFAQMGAWDDALTHADRYQRAEEWITIIKRLWSEPSVDFEGRFFKMDDCQSDPKPLSKPRPDLICAGQSDRGFDFATSHADACFIGGRSDEERRTHSRRARAVAAEKGKTIKVFAMCTVIHDDTDAKADAMLSHFEDGRDMGAIMAQMKSWGMEPEKIASMAGKIGASQNHTIVGSPATCREKLESYLDYCELDGVMLIFPDYVTGLEMFGAEILPKLRASESVVQTA